MMKRRMLIIIASIGEHYAYVQDAVITSLRRGFYDYKAILGIPEEVRTLFNDDTPAITPSVDSTEIDVYLSPSKVLSVQENTLYIALASSAEKTLVISGDVEIIKSIRFYTEPEKQNEIETAVFLEEDEPTATVITRENLPLYTKVCLTYKSINAEGVDPLRGGTNKVGGVLSFQVQSGRDFKEFSVCQSPLHSQTLKRFFAVTYVKHLMDKQRLNIQENMRTQNMLGDYTIDFFGYHAKMEKEIELQRLMLDNIPKELYDSKRPVDTGYFRRAIYDIYGGEGVRLPQKDKAIKI